ncbi:hypothetical protein I5U42_15830 [Stenotrophomonas maltophilia]|nr:hypothetical protein [Stenotrophomonas maltophilia]
MRSAIARRIVVATALTFGTTASAHAADYMCYAKVGPASNPQNSGTLGGLVQAENRQAAEAQYLVRASQSRPVLTGRWVVHDVTCKPTH